MLNSMPSRAIIKAHQGRLFSVLLLSVLLVMFSALGSWLFSTYALAAPEPQIVLPSEPAPLLTSLLRQKAIVWCIGFSILAMVSALLVATSPLLWWSRLLAWQNKWRGAGPEEMAAWEQEQKSAEAWLAAQEAALQAAQFQAMPATQPGEQPIAQNQPAPGPAPHPGQAQQAGQKPQVQQPQAGQQPPAQQQPQALHPNGQQPQAQQPDGQQPQTQQQPNGQQPQVQQPDGQQPQAQQPQGPTALQLLQAQEDVLDLEDITDIGDILSTFSDHDAVPAHLLALSQSLDDVEIKSLAAGAKAVAAHLIAGIERRASP